MDMLKAIFNYRYKIIIVVLSVWLCLIIRNKKSVNPIVVEKSSKIDSLKAIIQIKNIKIEHDSLDYQFTISQNKALALRIEYLLKQKEMTQQDVDEIIENSRKLENK